MDIDKPISLRPRFEHSTALSKVSLKERLEEIKSKYGSTYRFNQSDDHIWIHFKKADEKLFTPHLHLEIIEDFKGSTKIKGLYSPNSSYWTLFMFFHFLLATLFLALGIIAYSKYVLDDPIKQYMYSMIGIAVVWIGLYVFARVNRRKGLPQAKTLELIFLEWVEG